VKEDNEKLFREFCEDHLRMNGQEESEQVNHTTYDLFVQVYESVKEYIVEKQIARTTNDIDRFRVADEKLWRNGFAIMAFAIAEHLGWMKDHKPI
jgi:hypothetical protein